MNATEREKKLLWTVLNRSQWQPLIDEGLTTPEELASLQADLTSARSVSLPEPPKQSRKQG